MSNLGWTPVTKGLPKDLEEVIVTWVNTNPESYYSDIEGIPFSGAAVFYDDNWYWYSDLTQDILAEYGRCENMLIDDAIKITAWMPFPEPYKEESEDDHMIEISSGLWKSLRAAADYQIPKKPEKVCSGYADGHPVYDAYCPKCGNELDDGDKVCHECGQRIDWSDGKEE